MEICKDTPKMLIEVLEQIDIDKIEKSQLNMYMQKIYKYIDFFIPKRTTPFEVIEIDLPLPKEIGYILNTYDFNQVKPIYIQIAKEWIKSNLPMIENKNKNKKEKKK